MTAWYDRARFAGNRSGADAVPGTPDPDPDPPGEGTYTTQLLARLAPGALGGTVEYSFPILALLEHEDLATTVNGGESLADGTDIRLEIDGEPLAYDRVSYDASTGALLAWLRLPAYAGADGLEFDVFVGEYAGDDQANPSGTWGGYYLALDSAMDDRAAGRDFTIVSGMSPDSSRADAVVLPGDAFAELTSVSYRAGHSGIYTFKLLKGTGVAGTDIGVTDIGDAGVGGPDRTGIMRHRTTGFGESTAADTLFCAESFSDGVAIVQGPAGKQVTDWTSVAVNMTAGQTPELFMGGLLQTASYTAMATGTLIAPGTYKIGRGNIVTDEWTGGVACFHERNFPYTEHEVALLERVLNREFEPFQFAESNVFPAAPEPPDLDDEDTSGGQGDPDSGTTLPTAVRTVNITNQSQFNAAYADFTPGDHLVLQASGLSIPNGGNWAKSGSEASPGVIRADSVLGRTIGANFQINGSDIILHGLDLPSRIVSVGNSTLARRVKIWRCRWRNLSAPSTAIGLRTYACEDIDIAYCEWTSWGGRAIATGIASGTRRPTIRRCYFGPTPAASYTNAHEGIQLGFGSADRPITAGALIIECLFDAWNSDDEIVSIKSSGNIVRRCRFINCSKRLNIRLGKFNLFDANLFSGSGGIRVHDQGNEILGCDASGAGQGIRIATGDFETTAVLTTSSSPSTPYALDTYVGGCSGTLQIGAAFSGDTLDAKNTTVRQHTGTVSLVSGNHTGTDSQPEAAATGKEWLSLWYGTIEYVGPNGSEESP